MAIHAISDLHVGARENKQHVSQMRPKSKDDWLIVAGDVAEEVEDIAWALEFFKRLWDVVIWVPGNHDLWTTPGDSIDFRGKARYEHLVDICRKLCVLTPEDPYPVWEGEDGPIRVAPLFLLYDYSFTDVSRTGLRDGQPDLSGVECSDEYVLHSDPYPTRSAWCRARVALTERRLEQFDDSIPFLFVNHFPLLREPTRRIRHRGFAQWCGTTLTADWHTRFSAVAVVYGHLHIPGTQWYDGVPFQEVSLGYPRERPWRNEASLQPRPISWRRQSA